MCPGGSLRFSHRFLMEKVCDVKVLCILNVRQFHPDTADKAKVVKYWFSWRPDKVLFCAVGFTS